MSALPARRLSAADIKARLNQTGVRAVLQRLGVERVESYGRENWLCSAPYREDRDPSLSVHRESGLFNDKATGDKGDIFDLVMMTTGGTLTDAEDLVMEAAGILPSSTSPEVHPFLRAWSANRPENRPKRPPIIAQYRYLDKDGNHAFTVNRRADKSFFVNRPHAHGSGTFNGYGAAGRLLYHLPDVIAHQHVVLVEGEKDVDRLRTLGLDLAVTTSPGGAKGWRAGAHGELGKKGYYAYLAGKDVAIIPDNDAPGWQYAQEAASGLVHHAKTVRVIELPELGPRLENHGRDVSDWLDAGHTAEELVQRIQDAPTWSPGAGDDTAPPETNGKADVADFSGPALVIRPVTEYESEAVDWLWQRWLARGKLTIYAGVEGDGKSISTSDIIAKLTRGAKMPDGFRAPVCRVLLLIAEDGISDTIRPRLERHQARLKQVLILEAVRVDDKRQAMFSLAQHLPLLEEAIEEHEIDLVVIDPLSSFLQRADRNDEGAVRDLLTPLAQLAERSRVAVLGIAHMNRPNGTHRRATQRILGSTAFGAVARLVWMVAPADDSDDPNRRVLGVVKSNLAMKPPALAWSIPGEDQAIEWHGDSDVNVEELLDSKGRRTYGGGLSPERQDIVELLENADAGMSPQDIAATLKKSVSTTRNLLRRMEEDGQVVRPRTGIYTTPFHRCIDSVDSVDGDEHNDDAATTESMKSTNLHNGVAVDSQAQQFCRKCNALLPNQHLRNLGLCWDCAEAEAVTS